MAPARAVAIACPGKPLEEEKSRQNRKKRTLKKLWRAKAALAATQCAVEWRQPYETPRGIERSSRRRQAQHERAHARKAEFGLSTIRACLRVVGDGGHVRLLYACQATRSVHDIGLSLLAPVHMTPSG